MKNIKKSLAYFFAGGMLVLTAASCEKLKDFGTTNVNPNGTSDVLTSALITNVESQIGVFASSIQPGFYCQYFAEPTYPGTSRYALPQVQSVTNYSGPLMDCQVIVNKNTDPATALTAAANGSNASQIAMARVMKTYIYWTMTDRWGDLPYSEALKGANFLTPKYDTQEDIYRGMLTELTDAIAQFDENGAVVKGDVIYSGNILKWRKAANTLRMLISIRMSKRFPAPTGYAATQFLAAMNSPYGFISSNADNFTIPYPGVNYRNPWFAQGSSADNAVAQTFTDALTKFGDARIANMCDGTTGVPYGLTTGASTSVTYAKILKSGYRADNAPLVVLGAAYGLLAKAEAFELGWGGTTADAKIAYEAGVTASFDQWGVPGSAAAYLASGPAAYNTGAGAGLIGGPSVPNTNDSTKNNLSRIATQQWIAYYPDGTQGWSSWRKSEKYGVLLALPIGQQQGIPDVRPALTNLSPTGKIPRRYVYGVSEYSLNKAQLDIAIARLPGGDKADSRVWWDLP